LYPCRDGKSALARKRPSRSGIPENERRDFVRVTGSSSPMETSLPSLTCVGGMRECDAYRGTGPVGSRSWIPRVWFVVLREELMKQPC
jgi:hypothetical protein